MVGIFSRLSGGRTSGHHRRAQSALDERDVLPPTAEATGSTPTAAAHGIEVAIEFKPVEHPTEPLDTDRPVKCPLPEPSILNDGRIWKERMSATVRRSTDLPVMKEKTSFGSDSNGSRSRSSHTNRMILPSLSAPEHNLINMLEECNAAGI